MTPLLRPRSPRAAALLMLGVLALLAGPSSQAQVSAATANPSAPVLPSGLSPVSHLMVAGCQLALDSNGTLYRSDNEGKRWRQVKQQWDGKAVELLGIPALNSDHETFVAVLLKSTTALHWVSVDRGKTWKPSTLDDVRRNDVRWSGQ